jgi:hypothetical protein
MYASQRAPGSRWGFGSESTPTFLNMIIAAPRWTMPKKMSSRNANLKRVRETLRQLARVVENY